MKFSGFGWLFLFSPILLSAVCCNENYIRGSAGKKIGGGCGYAEYRGTANVESICQTADSRAQSGLQGGPGYEGYEIVFTFSTKEELKEQMGLTATNRKHSYRLANSWYVGPKYIETYRLREGGDYACRMLVITNGVCTPVLFQFDGIPDTDYFEATQ